MTKQPTKRPKMRNPFKPGTPEHFFWEHAAYSYKPPQTPEEGRRECAISLADAERRGAEAGLSFEWVQDTETDESFRDTQTPYYLWCCICRDESGEVLSSIGGVDFGASDTPGLGREPWGDPYRRVVEAELALEALRELD